MKPEELKVGMQFKNKTGSIITIQKIDLNRVYYTHSKHGEHVFIRTNYNIISGVASGSLTRYDPACDYSPTCKPLDQAFKTLDKQLCSHRNVREERYFSAMIYKTCKDCGKALN